jgi:hypothetical protein
MLCDEVKDWLYEYIYEELDEKKKTEIEVHLDKCDNCRRTYKELKALLIEDMEELIQLKEQIVIPKELSKKVERRLNRNLLTTLPRYAAAACIALIMFYTVPVAAYYIVQISPLDKYIAFDNGIIKEYEQGKGQLVQKSGTMKDITFTVDALIRKKDKTILLFTAKVPTGGNINYAMPLMDSRVITVKDQFGIKYRTEGSAMTLRSVNEDGEVKAIMYIEPLKFWAYKLSINITGMETGRMEVRKTESSAADDKGLEYDVQKYKNVYGSWKVDFYIDRSNMDN